MMRSVSFSVFLFIVSLSMSAQTLIFVSPSGNDNNSGDSNAPVKTIEKAQVLARESSGETMIYLHEGDYRLDSPIVLTNEDGNINKSLTIRSYPKEKAVIKGSVKLNTDWKPYRDGIMQTKVYGLKEIDMLIANGELRPMARYPNFDPYAVRFNGTSADATSKARVMGWKNPAGGFLHAMHVCDWGDFSLQNNR